MIRKISAHYIFPISKAPIKNGILSINESGKIVNIEDPKDKFKEIAGLEFYNGILVPGFVNTHCHLELSHLKGKLKENTGLPNFVSQISTIRRSENEIINKAINMANDEMKHGGIVAVGDISNTNYSFAIKRDNKIKYHTFLEVFTMQEDKANFVFERAKKLKAEIVNSNLNSSIVPHAPYSVSNKLFEIIKDENLKSRSTVCIHNQETESENELFINKSGELYEKLKGIGVNFDNFKAYGQNSLESYSKKMSDENKTLLVHNTYSTKRDIEKASEYFKNLYWSLCPNSNLFIEDKLPDISLLYGMNQKITLGTDSLASNYKLSVLDELKTINQNFGNISFNEILKWATLNGAEALGFDDKIGSFDIGKTPGINLISGLDYNNLEFNENTKLKVII